jgi:hypothetical protein
MPIHAIERSGRYVVIAIGDALTTRDVELVRDALALGPPGARVTVDLRRARTTEPAMLRALSRALTAAAARFELVGLTRASERLLRYLDADTTRAAASLGRSFGSDE